MIMENMVTFIKIAVLVPKLQQIEIRNLVEL